MIIHNISVSTVFPKDTVLSLSEDYNLKLNLINKIRSIICRDPVSIDFSYVGGVDASLGIRVDYYGPSIIIRSGIDQDIMNDLIGRYHGYTRIRRFNSNLSSTLLEVLAGSVAGCRDYEIYDDDILNRTPQGIIDYFISKLDKFINGPTQDFGEDEIPSMSSVATYLKGLALFYYPNRSSEFLRNLYRYYLHNQDEESKYGKFKSEGNGLSIDLIPEVPMSKPSGILYYSEVICDDSK